MEQHTLDEKIDIQKKKISTLQARITKSRPRKYSTFTSDQILIMKNTLEKYREELVHLYDLKKENNNKEKENDNVNNDDK